MISVLVATYNHWIPCWLSHQNPHCEQWLPCTRPSGHWGPVWRQKVEDDRDVCLTHSVIGDYQAGERPPPPDHNQIWRHQTTLQGAMIYKPVVVNKRKSSLCFCSGTFSSLSRQQTADMAYFYFKTNPWSDLKTSVFSRNDNVQSEKTTGMKNTFPGSSNQQHVYSLVPNTCL